MKEHILRELGILLFFSLKHTWQHMNVKGNFIHAEPYFLLSKKGMKGKKKTKKSETPLFFKVIAMRCYLILTKNKMWDRSRTFLHKSFLCNHIFSLNEPVSHFWQILNVIWKIKKKTKPKNSHLRIPQQ